MLRMSLLAMTLVVLPGIAQAQRSSCADCHFSNPDAPGHLYEWDRSPHGRNDVGCEKCHGGDGTTFESFPAHQEILNSRNPASPVNERNLPATCGVCHTGQFVAFQRSRHYALLQQGNTDGPTCTTCHSEVAAFLLSPSALQSRCANCHSQDGPGGHPEFPGRARALLESIREVRELLNQAQPLIRRVQDPARRASLEADYRQAEVPLIEAIQSGHSFVFDMLEDRREVARQRAEALLERLANPAGGSPAAP
jgi:hypothetical protein